MDRCGCQVCLGGFLRIGVQEVHPGNAVQHVVTAAPAHRAGNDRSPRATPRSPRPRDPSRQLDPHHAIAELAAAVCQTTLGPQPYARPMISCRQGSQADKACSRSSVLGPASAPCRLVALAVRPHPIEIPAIPDVGKAHQQHGKEHGNIDERDQRQLPRTVPDDVRGSLRLRRCRADTTHADWPARRAGRSPCRTPSSRYSASAWSGQTQPSIVLRPTA